ncbi:MAG: imidazole glycerol phosphate synthase subunit HisH [Armatimonadetes bacterium]|nr:imidazole glycerol phosphate synthase subunit HisH [Armatimonadota bacterium]
MDVAIMDYGVGNLRSVQKAFEVQGHVAVITGDADAIRAAPRVLLPGVGAFGAAANTLRETGLDAVAIEAAHSGKPFLGICVGMQLLFDTSEEMGTHRGLGIIPGAVLRFDERNMGAAAIGVKVPQIGWNSLDFPPSRLRSPLFAGLENDSEVYFVHSYFCRPQYDDAYTAARTDFIAPYTSAVWNGANVYGTQFHPEKSGTIGLQILDNFARL